ncbi:Protein kinase-like protein SCY1, partial [Frankliniella fusca]
ISWADGVSEDDDYFTSLAAQRGGSARGSASTVSAASVGGGGGPQGEPGPTWGASVAAGAVPVLVRQPSSASASSEEGPTASASSPLLGSSSRLCGPGHPTVVITCPSPSTASPSSSWVAVDVPSGGPDDASDAATHLQQPRRRLHRRNSISMPSLPTGLEMEHAAAEYDARLGRGQGDGYNTSDSFSDEEDDEEEQRRGRGHGGDTSR